MRAAMSVRQIIEFKKLVKRCIGNRSLVELSELTGFNQNKLHRWKHGDISAFPETADLKKLIEISADPTVKLSDFGKVKSGDYEPGTEYEEEETKISDTAQFVELCNELFKNVLRHYEGLHELKIRINGKNIRVCKADTVMDVLPLVFESPEYEYTALTTNDITYHALVQAMESPADKGFLRQRLSVMYMARNGGVNSFEISKGLGFESKK